MQTETPTTLQAAKEQRFTGIVEATSTGSIMRREPAHTVYQVLVGGTLKITATSPERARQILAMLTATVTSVDTTADDAQTADDLSRHIAAKKGPQLVESARATILDRRIQSNAEKAFNATAREMGKDINCPPTIHRCINAFFRDIRDDWQDITSRAQIQEKDWKTLLSALKGGTFGFGPTWRYVRSHDEEQEQRRAKVAA